MTPENSQNVPENLDVSNEYYEVWFIHGANATPTSFQYLKDKLSLKPELNYHVFRDTEYDCQEDLKRIIRELLIKLPRKTPVYLVGHSLGGVISAAAANIIQNGDTDIDLRGVLVMGSPMGGSESANYLRWLYPHYNLFKNIATNSPVIKSLKKADFTIPFVSLVTSSGNNPLFPTANDGVVTVLSQRALSGVQYIEIPCNHFEVLVSPQTVDVITQFLTYKKGEDEKLE